MILSFARTTASFIARRKRVTRRLWKDRTYEQYRRALEAAISRGEPGLLVDAWSAGPHRGGRSIGRALITSVTREHTCSIPDSDYEDEGFAYMDENGLKLEKDMDCVKLWRIWRQDKELVTAVIRFEVASIEKGLTPEMFFGRAA